MLGVERSHIRSANYRTRNTKQINDTVIDHKK